MRPESFAELPPPMRGKGFPPENLAFKDRMQKSSFGKSGYGQSNSLNDVASKHFPFSNSRSRGNLLPVLSNCYIKFCDKFTNKNFDS